MACILCFTPVADDERYSIYDCTETMLSTGVDLIQKHFCPIAELILSEEVLKNPQTCLCKTCWNNLDTFNDFYSIVMENYSEQPEVIEKYEVCNGPDDIIVFEEEPKDDDDLIKVEFIDDSISYVETEEWVDEQPKETIFTEETCVEPEPVKIVMRQQSTPKPKQQAPQPLDSADDQRIRETAKMFCDICTDKVDSLREAKAHFKSAHGVEGYIVCCGRKFRQRCRLVEHVNTHFNYVYPCPICSKNFDSRSYLTKHMACHDENKEFECDHCPKTFSRKFMVRNHLISVHIFDNVEPTFECPLETCEKKFVNYARLKHHIDYTHSTTPVEICDICSKTFKTKSAIEEHMRTHDRKPEDRIRCKICGHYLADMKSYNRHQRNHTTEHLENICSYCGKKSPNLNALRKHIKYVHEMEKSYQCRFCEKSFKRSRNLIDHEAAMHTLQDLYNCAFCPRTFRNQSNMLAHRKKQHPSEYQQPKYMRDAI